MSRQDIRLIDQGSYYDFAIDANGDIESDDSFETSLITCLLVDRRADESEVPTPQDRRGWIGTIGNEYKLGSTLWLYSQIRLTDVDIAGIRSAVISATKHFVDDGLVEKITATVNIEEQQVGFQVNIFRFGNKVDTRYFELWNNTGA